MSTDSQLRQKSGISVTTKFAQKIFNQEYVWTENEFLFWK